MKISTQLYSSDDRVIILIPTVVISIFPDAWGTRAFGVWWLTGFIELRV